MNLKPFDLFRHWLSGVQNFFPLHEARRWMEEELPEERGSWKRFRRIVYALFLRQL